MTGPALEIEAVLEESTLVKPGTVLKLDALETVVGPKDRRFSVGWLNYSKFVGKTYFCIAEKVDGAKNAYRIINHCLIGSQPETSPIMTAY